MFLSNFTSIHILCDVITILQRDCSCFLQMWLIQRAKYAAVCTLSNQLIPSSIFIYKNKTAILHLLHMSRQGSTNPTVQNELRTLLFRESLRYGMTEKILPANLRGHLIH